MPNAAALYCRISKDAEAKGLGVARQEADCRALADRKGWKIAEVYVDNDCSASRKRGKVRERPAYQRMIDDIKNGERDAVLAWEIDRLGRDPLEREEFFLLCERAGLDHLATPGDDVNVETGEGILMARIKGDFAAEETRKMSKRIRRKHLELAEAGKVSGGGHRPFGFETDRITHRADEVELLRDAAARILAGDSLYAIVGDWTRQGVPTSSGAPWSTTSLKSTLVAPRIAGLRSHRGSVVGPGVWEPILDRATWERVVAILTDPARRRNPVVRSYLLSGILSCGSCGKAMVAAPRTRREGAGARGKYRRVESTSVRAYGCVKANGGCGHVYALAEPIERRVEEDVLEALDGPGLAAARAAGAGSDEAAIVDGIASDEAKLLDLADDYDEGRIGKAEWLHLRGKVENRIAAARRQVMRRPTDALAGFGSTPGGLAAEWGNLSLDRRRAIIAAVIEEITVLPASGPRNRFNEDRVTLTWKA
jgi:site-specific DNA recombinase